MIPLENVLGKLERVRKCGNGFQARCPAHDDDKPSLTIAEGDDGRVLVKCQAGCESADVLEAIGLEWRDLFADSERDDDLSRARPTSSRGRIVARYVYRDGAGAVVGSVVRLEPKGFGQQRPDAAGGWLWGLEGVKLPLYRLPELLSADVADLVFLCEGEKDADALGSIGLTATTTPGGAGKAWREAFGDALEGRRVVILPDNDKAGRDHAEKAAVGLEEKARDVSVLALPDLPEKGDVSDWLAAGGTAARLLELADAATARKPSGDGSKGEVPTGPQWPVLEPEALHGLAGDIVRAFDPHTEADPAAVLTTFLVAFGNAAGRSVHCWIGETRHAVNLNAAVVGDTAKARKGESRGPTRRLFGTADPPWLAAREIGGVGSGEGIVWAIRDPVPKLSSGAWVADDPGVDDKRLMVAEEEFSSLLKVGNRDGSIVSETLRKAWDGRKLGNMVKRVPITATDPHVSVLGHITQDELRRELTDVNAANGLGNRFLWVCARRSKLLPDGGRLADATASVLAQRVSDALDFAKKAGTMTRSRAAAELWRAVYPELSKPRPGLLGSITARSEPQVVRLSMIYALLDQRSEIGTEHLVAALALWRYCDDSARYLFGDQLGDPIADRILAALRESGPMTETDLHGLLHRNVGAARIYAAVDLLKRHGLADVESVKTSGRTARRWKATENRT